MRNPRLLATAQIGSLADHYNIAAWTYYWIYFQVRAWLPQRIQSCAAVLFSARKKLPNILFITRSVTERRLGQALLY